MMRRFEHGGDVWDGEPTRWLDFSSNINPKGCPDNVQNALREAMEEVAYYPQVRMEAAIRGLERMLEVPASSILPTNGGIGALDLVISKQKPLRVVVLNPSFVEYERIAAIYGIAYRGIAMLRGRHDVVFPIEELERELRRGDMLVVCNPNNPTGCGIRQERMKQLLALTKRCGALLLVDEAFADFCGELSIRRLVQSYEHLIICGSLTKMFAVPGVRIGYVLANSRTIDGLKEAQTPWALSAFANRVAAAAGEERPFIAATAVETEENREQMKAALEKLGLYVFESCANYLLADMQPLGMTAQTLSDAFRPARILIRSCENYHGLDGYYVRMAVKSAQDNQKLIDYLKEILERHG